MSCISASIFEPAAVMPELRYFEDFPEGLTLRYGPWRVEAGDIIAFAKEFDPQPFHLDQEAAKGSVLQGLSASGWHVCAVMNRMIINSYLGRAAGMGSFGIEEIKWLKPVYPGDALMLSSTVIKRRISAKRPEMGIVTFRWALVTDDGTAKAEMRGVNLIRVRGIAA